MNEQKPDRLALLAFAAIVILAGFNGIAIRFSNQELPPFWGGALRFGTASAILFAVVLARRLPLPVGRMLAGAVIYGLLGFGITFAFIYWGLVSVQAGLGSVILALVPLLTFFFALAHGQERFRWRPILGGLLALAGIALVFSNELSANTPLLALLSILMGAAGFAESGVIIKAFPKSHPVTTNAVGMAVGAVVLLLLSWFSREAHPLPTQPATWAAVIFLVLVSCVIFVLFIFVIKRWTASATSYQFVLFPFITIAAGAWLAGERVTGVFLLGGLIVLAGVYIGALSGPALPRQSPEPRKALDT